MKISKIAPLCKRAKRILLLDAEDGTQWAGDGTAAYPLLFMPRLNAETVIPAMSFTEGEGEKLLVRHEQMPDRFETEDLITDEEDMGPALLVFEYYGRLMEAYDIGEAGIIFVPSEYLKPVRSCYDDVSLFIRGKRNNRYVAVKAGMMLMGIIIPTVFPPQELKPLTGTIGRVLEGCRMLIERQEHGDEELNLSIDPLTGEVIE